MKSEQIELTYDEEANTYRTTTPSTWNTSTTILIAIEQLEGVPVSKLPPMHSFFNVEALDQLFGSPGFPKSLRSGEFKFHYYGYEIRVYHHGTVTLSPHEQRGELRSEVTN